MKTVANRIDQKHDFIDEEYDAIITKLKTKRSDVPQYYYQLNQEQSEKNESILNRMGVKTAFLKNPRFRNPKPLLKYSDQPTSKLDAPENPFQPSPSVIMFTNYEKDCVYEQKLHLINVYGISRRLKYIPPGK